MLSALLHERVLQAQAIQSRIVPRVSDIECFVVIVIVRCFDAKIHIFPHFMARVRGMVSKVEKK